MEPSVGPSVAIPPFFVFECSYVPRKLGTEKTGTVNCTVENTLLVLRRIQKNINFEAYAHNNNRNIENVCMQFSQWLFHAPDSISWTIWHVRISYSRNTECPCAMNRIWNIIVVHPLLRSNDGNISIISSHINNTGFMSSSVTRTKKS
jgi:hypothetical protein